MSGPTSEEMVEFMAGVSRADDATLRRLLLTEKEEWRWNRVADETIRRRRARRHNQGLRS